MWNNLIENLKEVGVMILKGVIAPVVISALSVSGYQAPTNNTPAPVQQTSEISLGSYAPTGGGTYKTYTAYSSTATSIRLSSFKEPISNIPYTMAYLQSDKEFGTLDPQLPTKAEFISFTGITQNTDGTATLTGVTRGLSRSPGRTACTASTTLAVAHAAQAVFIVTSDSPCHFAEYAVKENDEAISGYYTFPTPLSNSNPATKGYVDGIVSGGQVTNAVTAVPGIAGETVASGTIVYFKQADARWYKAGVTITEASSTILGISQGNGSSGVSIASGVLLAGYDSNQSGLTGGLNYFLSPTAGALSSATSTRFVGRARDSTSIYFHPSTLIEGILYSNNTFTGSTTLVGNLTVNGANNIFTGATTTFSKIATSSVVITSTSSLQIGGSSAYRIGKNVAIFSTAGTTTFAVPNGITRVFAKVQAAGGGGGGTGSGTASGAGGGAGGYAEGFFELGATTSIQIFVGTAGTAGGSGNGGTGTWSTFGTNGSFASSTPGIGGLGSCVGVATLGGSAFGGELNISGQLGRCGTGDVSPYVGGDGGSSPVGMGGIGGGKVGVNGTAGTGFGSGGGAGAGAGNGAAAAGGWVAIYW